MARDKHSREEGRRCSAFATTAAAAATRLLEYVFIYVEEREAAKCYQSREFVNASRLIKRDLSFRFVCLRVRTTRDTSTRKSDLLDEKNLFWQGEDSEGRKGRVTCLSATIVELTGGR